MTNDEIGRQWFEQVWNKCNGAAIDTLLTPGAILHESGGQLCGPAQFRPYFDRICQTFSDVKVTINDTISAADKVCVRWTFTGTHSGEGFGIPASFQSAEVTGVTIFRIQDGRIAEGWQNWDMLGLMSQVQGQKPQATQQRAPTYAI